MLTPRKDTEPGVRYASMGPSGLTYAKIERKRLVIHDQSPNGDHEICLEHEDIRDLLEEITRYRDDYSIHPMLGRNDRRMDEIIPLLDTARHQIKGMSKWVLREIKSTDTHYEIMTHLGEATGWYYLTRDDIQKADAQQSSFHCDVLLKKVDMALRLCLEQGMDTAVIKNTDTDGANP